MINVDIIEQEIIDLEKKDTSYATIERLAWLYIVKDHMTAHDRAKAGLFVGSEFAEACSGAPMDSLMAILSEHMESLRAVYPKEYEALISRIKALSSP